MMFTVFVSLSFGLHNLSRFVAITFQRTLANYTYKYTKIGSFIINITSRHLKYSAKVL